MPDYNKTTHRLDNFLLSSTEVMRILNYKDRGSFWCLVYTQGIPYVRINARTIKFPKAGLDDWIRRRSSAA